MSDIRIRPPQSGDGDGLAHVWMDAANYYVRLSPEYFVIPQTDGLAAWLDRILSVTSDDELALVADDDGKPVGFLVARIRRPGEDAASHFVREMTQVRLMIEGLDVARDYWRRGIGTRLMEDAEDWGRGRGAVVALLDTYLGSPVSVPFYEAHLGYRRRALRFRKTLA